MVAPLYYLERLIAQFLATARERAPADRDGPFRHFVVESRVDAQKAFSDTPNALLVLQSSEVPERYKSESCILRIGKLRFEYVDAKSPFEFDAKYKSELLTVRYIIRGEQSYFAGNNHLFTAKAGDYTVRFSKSLLLRARISEDYRAFYVAFPVPTERSLSTSEDRDVYLRVKPYLNNDLVLTNPSLPWTTHLAYALDYALRRAANGTDNAPADRSVHELLYLLSLRELAAQARVIDEGKRRTLIPIKLKIAEDFVISNASRAPTAAEVATHAGLSERSLHTLFTRFRNISPSDFIREQRLQGVRTALRRAPPETSVAAIAAAWAFHQQGHFAAAYKKRFGELPSETLALKA